MNRILFMLALSFVSLRISAQSMAQLTITPANPTPDDTIYITSAFNYQGNCAFGSVFSYVAPIFDTIHIATIYCGYGLTTMCTSIETFSLDPLTIGNYVIKIEYHQGSICPVSNFDVLLGRTMAPLQVSVANGLETFREDLAHYRIFPNPSNGRLNISTSEIIQHPLLVKIRNTLGQTVYSEQLFEQFSSITLDHLSDGFYTVELSTAEGIKNQKFYLSR